MDLAFFRFSCPNIPSTGSLEKMYGHVLVLSPDGLIDLSTDLRLV